VRRLLLVLLLPWAWIPSAAATSAPSADAASRLVLVSVEAGAAAQVAEAIRQLGRTATPFPDLDVVVAGPEGPPVAWLEIPGVLGVRPNPLLRPLLDRTVPYIGAPYVWEIHGERGQNVSVLVLDTGIDGTHPDVRLGQNLVQNVVPTRPPNALPVAYAEDQAVTDVGGHGTHVAGILGASGEGSDARYVGVAPSVRIVGFSAGVTDPTTGDTFLDGAGILSGFQYALDNRDRYHLRVVSNSWGTNGTFDPTDPITHATLALYRAGFVVVFAGGNEGREGEGTMNPYSLAPWVLSVAAGNLRDQRANFSSMGTDAAASGLAYDHPDLMAPGTRVVAPKAGSDPEDSTFVPDPDRGGVYTAKSGTSMAAPHVAGAAALLLSHNPELSPDDVYDVLVATSRPTSEPLWQVGRGYLDAYAAFQASLRMPGTRTAFLEGAVRYAGPASGDPAFAKDAASDAHVAAVERAPPSSTATSASSPAEPTSVGEPKEHARTPPGSAWVAIALAIILVLRSQRPLAR